MTTSACARMPHELLEMSFRYLFPDWEYLHDKVRRTTEIGFVCKDWKAAVKPVAFDALQLDPYDAEAVAYFDPTSERTGRETAAARARVPRLEHCYGGRL